jgi:Ser/Thr protein kinase RdoA (MazF antagonist)
VAKLSGSVFAEVLSCVGVGRADVQRLRGRSQLWLVDHPSGKVVLRHHDPAHRPADAPTSRRDIEWLHDRLRHVADSGFPAPRPAPIFEGRSCETIAGSLWESVTYLPGRAVGWSRRPTLRALGAFLAEFHNAVAGIGPSAQRPLCRPVDGLVAAAANIADVGSREATRFFAGVAADLEPALEAIAHRDARRITIHGDFTAHNVVAASAPTVAPVGVIDFANAYNEAALADISFGLWRTGRTSQRAETFAAARFVAFVTGYRDVRPLNPEDAAAIVVYLRARGVQIIIKHTRPGTTETSVLARLRWLEGNGRDLQHRIELALEGRAGQPESR